MLHGSSTSSIGLPGVTSVSLILQCPSAGTATVISIRPGGSSAVDQIGSMGSEKIMGTYGDNIYIYIYTYIYISIYGSDMCWISKSSFLSQASIASLRLNLSSRLEVLVTNAERSFGVNFGTDELLLWCRET